MSSPLTPSKRSRDRSFVKPNGKGKWHKPLGGSRSQNQSFKLSPGYAVFRVLFHVSRIGSLIGGDGDVLSQIREETGVEIRVEETVHGSNEKIVVIAGPNQETEVNPEQNNKEDKKNSEVEENGDDIAECKKKEDKDSPPLEDGKQKEVPHLQLRKALFLVSEKFFDEEPAGSVVKQMSSDSGAQIRILPRDKLPTCAASSDELVPYSVPRDVGNFRSSVPSLAPKHKRQAVTSKLLKCAAEDEEVVQINGEPEAVQDAMLQITTLLRHHFFRDAFPSLDALSGIPSLSDLRDDQPPFLHRPGASLLSDRKPWSSQGGRVEGGVGLPDFAGAHRRRMAGFGGGNNPAIITSTTVEVVLPRNLVPVICGENGECLRQIRQVSDAKITISEPKQGAVETLVIISGTPEQTHAAQSLIQAFVISETESS
ncbi:KH domain-containing protein HEN4, partial [Cucurbita argyrosperma subsp. argyrosperma]